MQIGRIGRRLIYEISALKEFKELMKLIDLSDRSDGVHFEDVNEKMICRLCFISNLHTGPAWRSDEKRTVTHTGQIRR